MKSVIKKSKDSDTFPLPFMRIINSFIYARMNELHNVEDSRASEGAVGVTSSVCQTNNERES